MLKLVTVAAAAAISVFLWTRVSSKKCVPSPQKASSPVPQKSASERISSSELAEDNRSTHDREKQSGRDTFERTVKLERQEWWKARKAEKTDSKDDGTAHE
ncbi:hypothetical protein L596_025794 [Steinernema carpocapsae]|uniref:Secreted protein n=1 Tax=Steinernema carpocapsae TaxID=34508 RepID=A0A4U5M9Z0_STECR|nr:hypothetical protein L596_025794 [Steinernema carpocapsae]